MDESERLLAGRLARGDSTAFAELYAAHGAGLYGYALSATGQREVAEDLLQAVWLRLVRYRRRLRRVENLRAYLFAALRNELRRRSPARAAPSVPGSRDDSGDDRTPASPENGEELRAAVAHLSPERREVVALKAWHGLTFAEIGQVLAISPNTAASRYRLALTDLRERLREAIDAAR